MSLADQSQQWFPTSVQVTVHQARSLRVKGKNGTNDAYAIIQVAKDKFSTSVAEKCVAPVWKEEASFDLPLFHPGNADRCTLYVIVMHRAQVGLDKFLGQAVVNLLELHDNKGRKKTDWFKLVDKTGKEDKARGEVLLDIHFMRNNMSASMFDLSMQDKPRSRISKLKDKVRGKKKDGFSDSASAIVPSVSQVLTDSEGEADSVSLNQATGEPKKKSKLKTLFAPKSNLQRNISQSMSTLGTLPEKNSSVSSSRSSGLNVDSPDAAKKKFKFLGHKRTGSSDSKVSQGPFSLLGRSKQSNSDLNSLCINGNHVYAEDADPKSGSTLSLNSSGQGSVEDMSADFRGTPSRSESADKAAAEQQRHQEELERRQAEENKRAAEAKRLEEEKYRAEAKRMQEEEQRRLQEEQEFKRRFLEEEARRRKQKEEEEEERRKQEEKRRGLEAAEKERLEEERRRQEEQKTQEESSMSDRLSSLFGMIKKKEEKKEEEQLPTPAPRSDPADPDHLVPHRSTNPFEAPSATVFLNRTAKVSAVKPRLTHSVTSDSPDCQSPSQECPSPGASETTLSSVPSESPETFSSLHTSLAPPDLNQNLPGSPAGAIEELSSGGSSPTMADKKRRAPLPPVYETQTRDIPSRDFPNPSYDEADASQPGMKGSLPLPDYETLFPQKRHGVKGNTGWDHLIAEVNQKHRDTPPELMGPEMSVDAPEVHEPRLRRSPQPETPAVMHYKAHPQDSKPVSTKKAAAPTPPKPAASAYPSADYQSQRRAEQTPARPNPSPVTGQINSDTSSRESLPGISRDGPRQALQPPPRPLSQTDSDAAPPAEQRKEPAPTARPRQKVSVKEPAQQEPAAVTAALSHQSTSDTDQKERVTFDPFPSSGLLSADPWAPAKPKREADDIFTRSAAKEQKPEDRGMSVQDLDNIFGQDKPAEPFTGFTRNNSLRRSENGIKDEVSQLFSAAFQRKSSQKRRQNSSSMTDKAPKAQQEPAARKGDSAVTAPKPPANGENPFGSEPFTVPSDLTSSEPPQVSLGEPAQQPALLSGGKPPLRAWVSPSEVQPVSAQNNSGGGLAPAPRRPHPVKPLSSSESQNIFGNPAVKDMKISESISGKFKTSDSVGTGPYTQLTQDELITLVVKQQADLSKKDAKIMELEEYIDNLLVRVIDEKPSILNALNAPTSNVSSA